MDMKYDMKNEKVLGIITEYNPFHNGHLYHLQESKKCTSADFVVCVMSGNFVQRGEPAIINKWARANAALLSGADLIIEIPVVYSIQSAEFFAFSAVKILNSLGIVNYLSFGSEIGLVEPLKEIAHILASEPENYKTLLLRSLALGISYPKAVGKALEEYLISSLSSSSNNLLTSNISEIISSSNNILGIEYLKALKKENSSIIPITIKRKANLYKTKNLTGVLSSATAIREYIVENLKGQNLNCETRPLKEISISFNDNLKMTLPIESIKIIEKEIKNGKAPVLFKHFENIILALIRKMSLEDIRSFPDIKEGLEYRIKYAAEISATLNHLIKNICTKRYTKTRVQRTLLNILLGITNSQFQAFNDNGGPQYIRVLGFNEKGAYLLSKIKDKGSLPIITKTANYKDFKNPLLNKMLEIEAISTDIYVLAYKANEYRKAKQEFTNSPIIIK
jgi:predicted nucleotidyltransferase